MVPLALGLVLTLLYISYGNVIDTLRVFTGVPFAWTGGIIALYLRDMPFLDLRGDWLCGALGRGRSR